MPRARKLKVAPIRELPAKTLDTIWPLPVNYRCDHCGAALMGATDACQRKNSRGVRICRGTAEPAPVYRAMCKCMAWIVTERQLLQRCPVCHRRMAPVVESAPWPFDQGA